MTKAHFHLSNSKVHLQKKTREYLRISFSRKINPFLADKDIEWTGLKFSPDGKTILISTNGSMIRLIDAFSGNSLQTFTGHMNTKNIPLEASFSPDSQYVLSGSTDGRVHIWNAENGTKICVLKGDHTGPVRCFQFNPKSMMMASTCKNMVFWLPSLDDDA